MPDENVTHVEITLTEATDRDLRRAAMLEDALPEVGQEIDGMMRTTMAHVYKLIRDGGLTPDKAMSYWMEMYGYDRLRKRLTDKAAAAKAVTETNRRN